MLCDAAPAAATTGSGSQQGGGSLMGPFLPMLLILGIFYFMMIRPQQRKEKERRRKIEELKAGAKVIFAGGLMGQIVEVTEKNTFKVEIAPNTVIEIAKNAVSAEVPTEAAPAK